MHFMIALIILSGVLSLGAFIIVSTKREFQKTEHLALAILCTCIYIAGGFFEATSNSHFSAYRAIIVEYLGVPFIAPHAFLAIADFYEKEINRHLRRLLFVFPWLCCILVAAGNPYNLFYASTSYVPDPLPHLLVTPTPLYILSVSYTLVLLLLTQGMIFKQIQERKGHDHQREVLLIIAIGLPILSNLLYQLGFTPSNMDLTPIVLAVTSGLVTYAVQRLNLLQLLPLAKSTIVDKMTDAFIVIDNQCRFLEANRAAKDIFPSLERIEVGEKFVGLENLSEANFAPCGPDQEYPSVQTSNGRFYHVSQTNIAYNGKTVCSCIMLYDITETQSLIEILDKKATHDALTQIYNRDAFFRLANVSFVSVLKQAGQAAIVMFDLDHFKIVNDTYGHMCGDAVLQAVAQRLAKRLRDTDIFGRYGGEEFCTFLIHISADSAVVLANELRHCIEAEPFLYEGHSISLTISVGVAVYDKRMHTTLEDMIRSADEALYTAKNSGRNQVVLFDGNKLR
ncbi:diguanylate cyclase [Ruminococcaceae bacterium OttesenSCG-928-I18]|nr:diguanylate cyclase [Ruminococcaceae bacterium OttesenSCG-928-I18]